MTFPRNDEIIKLCFKGSIFRGYLFFSAQVKFKIYNVTCSKQAIIIYPLKILQINYIQYYYTILDGLL